MSSFVKSVSSKKKLGNFADPGPGNAGRIIEL